MSRNSTYEPEVLDEDLETIGDRALGLLDREPCPVLASHRLQRVGAKLTARGVFSDRRKSIFIRTLAECGIVGRAATAAGWSSGTAYAWRKTDPEFAKLWDMAIDFATDALEEAARRRAVHGVQRPVYQQKELVGYVTEYSDNLLGLLLKAKRPQEFRENVSVQADVKGGVLVVPGVASSSTAWESAAGSNQAEHRANQGITVIEHEPLPADDPLA